MYLSIRGIVVFVVLAPLPVMGQMASPYRGTHDNSRIHRNKASLVPPPPLPEVVEPLPVPLAPLIPATLSSQPPRVTYVGGVLTVDAQDSTLSDILKAIRTLTGAEFDPMPEVAERTAMHFSGSPSEVISDLLRGSEFGYVLISSQEDSAVLQKVLLIPTEPSAGAKLAAAKVVPPRLVPPPPSVRVEPVVAPTSSELAVPVAIPAATTAAPPKDSPASEPPQSTPPEGLQAATPPLQQQGIALPDPVQVAERANQLNQANQDKTQPPMNGAGQYMQELYKLRLQQQPGQAPSAQSSAATRPQ